MNPRSFALLASDYWGDGETLRFPPNPYLREQTVRIRFAYFFFSALHCIALHYGAKCDWDFRISDLVKIPDGADIDFLWISVKSGRPVSQIHFPHPQVGAPGIFSDLLRSVHILKREWGAESNGKLPHLFIPGKTAALVHEFAVKDLPLQNCSLCSALGQNNDIYIYNIY